MNDFSGMFWVEFRKAIRSRMPLWTTLGSLFIPLGVAFLILVAKNPGISHKLGLIGAKANLLQFSTIDWPAYLGVFGQIIGTGGFFLFILVTSWVFGREFSDGTLKDMLAVPVQRSSIILAKFTLVAAWSVYLSLVIYIAGGILGALIDLPGISISVFLQDGAVVGITALLVLGVVIPFALLASVGRGYLLPIGVAALILMMANLAMVLGRGEYFPWAIPGIFAQGETALTPASYWIVLFTGLAGMAATYLWWKYADQNH